MINILKYIPSKLVQVVNLDNLLGKTNPYADTETSLTAEEMFIRMVRSGLYIILFVLFLVFIYVIVMTGLKFVQSQGNSQEYEDAQKSLKNLGVGAGVGIVLIIAILIVMAQYTG